MGEDHVLFGVVNNIPPADKNHIYSPIGYLLRKEQWVRIMSSLVSLIICFRINIPPTDNNYSHSPIGHLLRKEQ